MMTVAAAAGMATAGVTTAAEAMAATAEAVAAAGKTVAAAAKVRREIVPSPERMESARMARLSIRTCEGIRRWAADSMAETRRGRAVRLRGRRVSQAASAAIVLHGSSVWARAIPGPLSISGELLRAGSVRLKSITVALRPVPKALRSSLVRLGPADRRGHAIGRVLLWHGRVGLASVARISPAGSAQLAALIRLAGPGHRVIRPAVVSLLVPVGVPSALAVT